MIGQVLGHYRLLDEIGSGGMGVVYRARDERLERDVAVKVLPAGSLDPAARQRFRREALALSRTVHPNIATIHDFDTQGETDFLVMELIPGRTADGLASAPLPPPDVVALGVQLAAGLEAAHASQVIHRDLKPSNLMVTPDGRLKILDFGIARLRLTATATTRTDTAGRPAGTLPYMAPEQVRGEDVDARTDIYAAGVVLYELATGRRPFAEQHEPLLIDAILNRDPVPPRTLAPGIPPPLESCLLKALDKDPSRRYQSAAELGVDLRRVAADAAGAKTRRWSRGRTRWAALAACAAAAIVAALVWAPARWPRSEPPAAAETPAAAPSGRPLKLGLLLPQNLTGRRDLDEWAPLVQALFPGELTGVQDLGVLDPLSLNDRLAGARSAGETGRSPELLQLVRHAGADLLLDTHIVPGERAPQLQTIIVNPKDGEARFSTRAGAASERELPQAVGALAKDVVSYFQLQVFGLDEDHDMRPWFSLRERDIDAVKAFAQANQYIYRLQLAEVEEYLRTAIDLDPPFVAPRVWLISGLLSRRRRAEAASQLVELQALEATANPFEQTMIRFIGAKVRGDWAAQIPYLELALGYSPGNNILLVNLAEARAQTGECARAVEALAAPLEMKWAYPSFYALWGWCMVDLGRPDEARRVLRESLSLPAVDPNVYALLEALEIAIGAEDEARRYGELHRARLRELKREQATASLLRLYDRLARYCEQHGAAERAVVLSGRAKAFQDELNQAVR